MAIVRTDLDHLALLIERLLDAELLLDVEGAGLLREIEAARKAMPSGDAAAARGHLSQVVRFIESLVTARVLGLAEGYAVLETARRMLATDTD